jgi:hypothetical protein
MTKGSGLAASNKRNITYFSARGVQYVGHHVTQSIGGRTNASARRGQGEDEIMERVGPQSTYICRVQNSVWRLPKY